MIKPLFIFLLLPLISYSSNYKGSHSKESISYPKDQFESIPFLEEEFTEAEVALEDENRVPAESFEAEEEFAEAEVALENENMAPVESFELEEDKTISDAEESYSVPIKRRSSKSYRNPSQRPRVTHRDTKEVEEVAVEDDRIVSSEKPLKQSPVRKKQANRAKSGKKNVQGATSKASPQKRSLKQDVSPEVAQEDAIQERQALKSRSPIKTKRQPAKETAFEENAETAQAAPAQEEKQTNRPLRKSVRSASSGLRKKSVAQAPADAASENSIKPTKKLGNGKERSSLNQQQKAKSSQHRSAKSTKRPLHG